MASPDVMAQMLMGGGGPQGGAPMPPMPPPGGPGGAGMPPPGMGGPPPLPQAAPGPDSPMSPMQAKEFLNQLGISEAALPLVAKAVSVLMPPPAPMMGPPMPGAM